MDAKSIIIIMLAIVMVLLIIIGLASTMPGTSWNEIAHGVSGFIVVIIAFAVAVGSIILLARRR